MSGLCICFPLLVLALACSFNNYARGEPDTTPINTLCSGIEYDFYDPYGGSVGYVLTDVTIKTPTIFAFEYYSTSPWPNNVAYGYGACNKFLEESECHDCLSSAFVDLVASCSQNTGAQVELRDCYLRYENYPFQENV